MQSTHRWSRTRWSRSRLARYSAWLGAFLLALTLCAWLTLPTLAANEPSPYEGRVIRGSGDRIYLIEQGQRRWITSMTVFTQRWYRWDDIVTIPDATLQAIPDGRPLRTGTLVRASVDGIFLLEAGRQRWIPSLDIFVALGYEWTDIQPIRDVDLAGYPPGPPLHVEPLIRDPALVAAVQLLANTPGLVDIVTTLRTFEVPIIFETLPDDVGASFHIRTNVISVQPEYKKEHPTALAALLVHEGTHAAQFWRRPEPTIGGMKCYAWELEAFLAEAKAWTIFHGRLGKADPKTDLERSHNLITRWVNTDEAGFRRVLQAIYQEQCG